MATAVVRRKPEAKAALVNRGDASPSAPPIHSGPSGSVWASLGRAAYLTQAYGLVALGLGLLTVIYSFEPAYDTKRSPEIITAAIPGFLVMIILEIIICRIRRYDYYRVADTWSSINMGVFEQLWTVVLFGTLFPYSYLYIHENYAIRRIEGTFWSNVVVFLLIDYCYYWLHRMAHEWNGMWAGHIVHHNSEDYNLSTALRQGLWQSGSTWMFYLPAAFFFVPEVAFVHKQVNTLYQFWIHTQLIGKLPWPLEFILNTPSHHRVHHGRNPQYIDKNYGGVLIIYDRLFGTFEPEAEPVLYGITHKLDTWNPLYAQFHHWAECYQASRLARGWLAKLRFFVNKGPGDNYQALYASKPLPPDHFTPRRYDSKPSTPLLTLYAASQGLVVGALAVLWPLAKRRLDTEVFVAGCCLVTFGQVAVSLFLDRKRTALYVEIVRLFVYEAAAVFLASTSQPGAPWLSVLQDTRVLLYTTWTVLSLLTLTVAWARQP